MSEPRLTIGLVVRNGEAHLEESLRSLRTQSFRNYVVRIFDNASEDATPVIARAAMLSDSRISYIRHDRDLGPLRNMIIAAGEAVTEYFCWATHDDVHDPLFCEHLIGLLDGYPSAALACSAVRNMDPDGTWRDLRLETNSLRTTLGLSPFQRVKMYLQDGAGTPFYGIYRTQCLKELLPLLDAIDRQPGPLMIGTDMVFLAALIAKFDLAVTHMPLLLFRRGGWSHRLDTFRTLRGYLSQLLHFWRWLGLVSTPPRIGLLQRMRLCWHRARYFAMYFASKPMRQLTGYYLRHSNPFVHKLVSWYSRVHLTALRLLARRCQQERPGTTMGLFGAGKHSQRLLQAMQAAAHPHVEIIALYDDRPAALTIQFPIPVLLSSQLREMAPDILLVSSDSYEQVMFRRAAAIVPPSTRVWALYDTALEHTDALASCDSTDAMNSSAASIAS
jgi:glycosyltransferase involved in cell wall biosynthesis